MQLSIVIVSWNTRDILADCLASLEQTATAADSRLSTEVFVVDNASTDGTAEMIIQRFPWVTLIQTGENLGFARGNNRAIQLCRGRYILLLNPDTVVKPGAITTLVDFLDTHPEVGAAGARLLNGDGTLQTSSYPEPTLSRELWRLFHLDKVRPYGVYHMQNWDLNTPRSVDILLGACILVRRDILDQMGAFDEAYFMYSEEVDLCHRIQKAGWPLYWVPQAEVVHYGGQSTQQVAFEMFLQLYASKLLYFRKNHGWLKTQAYKLILLAALLGRLALAPLAWVERGARREHHLALANRYWRLLTNLPQL